MLLGDVLQRPFAAWLLQCSVATLQAKGHIAKGHIAGAWVQPPARQRAHAGMLLQASAAPLTSDACERAHAV